MLTLTAGQRVKLYDLASTGPLTIEVSFQGPSREYDTSCFLLGEREQLLSDDHLVFYNNPTSRDGAVRMGDRTSYTQCLTLDVSRLEKQARRLAITTIDDHTFRDITSGTVRILQDSMPVAQFTCTGSMFQGEKALILLEIYFKDVWRLGVLAQGFKGGLADLITHYGGEVDPTPAPAPEEPKVNLSKITLQKDTSITLKKPPNFTARLIWTGQGDLDFYCFYVTEKGQCGKVYWNMRGSALEAPFITLDQDAVVNHLVSQAEETIRVHRTGHLRYLLFAAYSALQNGAGAFKTYEPHAIIQDGLGQEVRVPLLNKNTFSYWVAIAKVTFNPDGTYTVERVEKYSKRHYEMSPTLHENGTVTMNTGPIEFKPF